MDKLSGDELKLACKVIHERYKKCVQTSFSKDLLGSLDATAPTRKCGALFADLQEFCTEYIRSGELQLSMSSRSPGKS